MTYQEQRTLDVGLRSFVGGMGLLRAYASLLIGRPLTDEELRDLLGWKS